MDIIWSPLAKETYRNTIEFILLKWTLKEAEALDIKVEALIKKLRINKNLCPVSDQENLRKCVVSPQTSLIYEVKEKVIELIIFIDNRSKHTY